MQRNSHQRRQRRVAHGSSKTGCRWDALVVNVLPLAVDLIDQGEVEVEALHSFPVEHSYFGLVLLVLHVFDHVWEPHSQAVVTESDTKKSAPVRMTCKYQ